MVAVLTLTRQFYFSFAIKSIRLLKYRLGFKTFRVTRTTKLGVVLLPMWTAQAPPLLCPHTLMLS